MQLDSYLEIFTTLYGWAFANLIGEVITGTGLVILPFALLIFNDWREAREQGAESSGGVLGLIDRIGTRLFVALFVMAVCFATSSVTSLSNLDLSYTPPGTAADPSPQPGSSQGGTGSGYDAAMRDASDGSMSATGNLAFVPPWWYTVMALSSGVNFAVRNGLRGGENELRMIENLAHTSTIEDPNLRHEIQRFWNECFTPARSNYLTMNRADIPPDGQAILQKNATDVNAMGSTLFRTVSGFYDSLRAREPVPGWPVNCSRDTEYPSCSPSADKSEAPPDPQWGKPMCIQWWVGADGQKGLREEMISHSSAWTKLSQASCAAANLVWADNDQCKDSLANLAQYQANPDFTQTDTQADYGTGTKVWHAVTATFSTTGVVGQALNASFSLTPLLQGLPMLQALVLMSIYMFLPLIVFLSGFDLKVMFYGAVAIFTVKFWASMWFIAQWVDGHLVNAMYPSEQGSDFMKGLIPAAVQGYKQMILNALLLAMFVGLPMIWTAMMTWIGLRVGVGVGEMLQSAEGQANAAGKSGKAAAGGAAKTVVGGVIK
ncbi:MAG: conjugal transfer protein TraG N-terminal domain-containing protein [Desulfovibrionaceae bacterium]|nr:conjugal transfer protein TraG N-terminal domain-containing protein [Desulfovibrionaceae bacterium]